jgi:NAD(P)-dependent dehydrogenase (short-subunit alcohol dehydrogenase family)
VAILDIDGAKASDVARELESLGSAVAAWSADVTSEPAIDAAFASSIEWLGGLDGIIHCAGIMAGQNVALAALPLETWRRVIEVNLTGTFIVVKRAAAEMSKRASGVIVLISSRGGVSDPSGSLAYGGSKGGMHGLGLTLQTQLAPAGIRVLEVCPALVDTPLARQSISEGYALDPERSKSLLDRLHPPDGIASIIAFLLSPQGADVAGPVFTNG